MTLQFRVEKFAKRKRKKKVSINLNLLPFMADCTRSHDWARILSSASLSATFWKTSKAAAPWWACVYILQIRFPLLNWWTITNYKAFYFISFCRQILFGPLLLGHSSFPFSLLLLKMRKPRSYSLGHADPARMSTPKLDCASLTKTSLTKFLFSLNDYTFNKEMKSQLHNIKLIIIR